LPSLRGQALQERCGNGSGLPGGGGLKGGAVDMAKSFGDLNLLPYLSTGWCFGT